MKNQIENIFASRGITRLGYVPISECEIINERILPKDAKTAMIFIIPYRSSHDYANDGFSEYARIYDYHKFASSLYEKVIDKLKDETGYNFYGFCDHSPINEKLAAAICGLGVIGRNSLLIDSEFGSFVFIGSLITDAEIQAELQEVSLCINCRKCIDACPNLAILEKGIDRSICLSAISQKKTKSDSEKALLKANNIIWGCDICQIVCPYNVNSKISPIDYFKNTRIERVDKQFIESLSDDEFAKYAFSYKGRKIVLDNIDFV